MREPRESPRERRDRTSGGEVIIGLDADAVFHPAAIGRLTRHPSDPAIGAVGGNAKVGNLVNVFTRWQALEYVTNQNLNRRAFDLLNCVTVVPGAVGAWRRELIAQAGGFTGDTLAEDADLCAGRLVGADVRPGRGPSLAFRGRPLPALAHGRAEVAGSSLVCVVRATFDARQTREPAPEHRTVRTERRIRPLDVDGQALSRRHLRTRSGRQSRRPAFCSRPRRRDSYRRP